MRLARLAPVLAILIGACQAAPATIPVAGKPIVTAAGHRPNLGEAELGASHLVAGQIGLVTLEHPSHAAMAGDTGTAGVDVVPFDVEAAGPLALSFDARGAAHRVELLAKDGQVLVKLGHGEAWTGNLEAGSYTLKLYHDGSGAADGGVPFFVRYERAPNADASRYALLSTDQLAPGQLAISGRGCPSCDLSGSYMGGTDYSYLDFSGSRFRGARLDNSTFDHANLEGADFSPDWALTTPPSALIPPPPDGDQASQSRALLDVPTASASLPPGGQTRIINTSFQYARLRGARFNQVSVSQQRPTWTVNFDHADARGIDFSGATIDAGSFQGTNLDDGVMQNATFTRSTFAKALARRLAGQFMTAKSCSWANASLADADFAQATITQGDFTAADLTRASFFDAHLEQTRFPGAIMRDANLAVPGDPSSQLDGLWFNWQAAGSSYNPAQDPLVLTGTLTCATPGPQGFRPSVTPCRVLP